MTWWESTEVLSRFGTWVSALIIVLGVVGLVVKVQLERVKHSKDRISLVERQKREAVWQQELDEANRKAQAAEQKTKPRVITPEQRESLLKVLSAGSKGPVVIWSDWIDMEAKAYAGAIESILSEAGFEILQIRPEVLTMGWNGPAEDRPFVILFVTDIDHPLPHAYSIQKAFLDNGVSTTAMRASADIEKGHPKDVGPKEWKLDGNTAVLWVMTRM